MEFHIGKAKVLIINGDISEQDVDAIGLAANDRLWMGGRVAEAIKRKAGEDIETEAMKQGPLGIGEIAVTTAGEMVTKNILHAVIMGQDLAPTEETIRKGTRNLLTKANKLGLDSLAIPAFGTGMAKLEANKSAEAMVDEIIIALLELESIRELRIVLLNQGIYNAFAKEFHRKFSK